MKTHGSRVGLLATVYVLLLVVGCTRDPAVLKQRHLEKAQAYYAKSQYNEAIVELKNALQIDPKFAPAVHLNATQVEQDFRRVHTHLEPKRDLSEPVKLLGEA